VLGRKKIRLYVRKRGENAEKDNTCLVFPGRWTVVVSRALGGVGDRGEILSKKFAIFSWFLFYWAGGGGGAQWWEIRRGKYAGASL